MIELPFPHKILWPNGRGHHMAKHRHFQNHKQWAYAATLSAVGRRFDAGERVRWSATFYPKPKTNRAIDKDNAAAALKAYQDGIALALGVDDSRFEQPQIHFAERVANGRVVIVLESA